MSGNPEDLSFRLRCASCVNRRLNVDDQGLDTCGHPSRLAAARRLREEIHPARDAVAGPEAVRVQHLGETDVADPRRHAREALLPETVADDRGGDVRAVSVIVNPQVIGLDVRPVRTEPSGVVREIGAADAVAVRGDVQVVDVESRIHHGDGHRYAAGAREDPRGAVVDAQRVRTHRGHGRVVGRFDQADGLHREHEIGRGQRFDHGAAGVRPVDAQRRVVAAHDRAEVFHRQAPATVGVPGHQRDVDWLRGAPGGSIASLNSTSLAGTGARPARRPDRAPRSPEDGWRRRGAAPERADPRSR